MIFLEIWRSYRALPLWVQIWVTGILVPVNSASMFFLSQPLGIWVAVLALGAMLPNIAIMRYERGLSKMMAFPHLLPWGTLVVWLLSAMPEGGPVYSGYLWILLVVDSLSLVFDISDALKWLKGDRRVAGK
jgi:hypothetical protein